MATLRRLSVLLILFGTASLISGAANASTRVVVLGGSTSIELPAGWQVVENEQKCLVGPRSAPFVDLAYIEFEPANDVICDLAFATQFLKNNLKITDIAELPGGRVMGHTSSGDAHQWNIAKPVDARHLAILLVGMDGAVPYRGETIATVDRMALSAEFLSHK